MIYVSCELWAPICRSTEYDYVRGLKLSVYAQADEQILLGRYHAELLLISEAESVGMSLHEVCDAHSGDMEHLYCSLFEPKDEKFQPELELDEFAGAVLFLWNSVLHPKLKAYEAGLLETVGTLLGNETVLVLHRNVTSLTEIELARLGFAKIAETDFIFRHMAVLSPFTQEHPQGVDVPLEFTVSKEDERWVQERLKKE